MFTISLHVGKERQYLVQVLRSVGERRTQEEKKELFPDINSQNGFSQRVALGVDKSFTRCNHKAFTLTGQRKGNKSR